MEEVDKLRWAKRLGFGTDQTKLPKHFVEFWDRYCKRYYDFHSNRTPNYSLEGMVAFMAEVDHENRKLIDALTARIEAVEAMVGKVERKEKKVA